jgi:hypothetical protein
MSTAWHTTFGPSLGVYTALIGQDVMMTDQWDQSIADLLKPVKKNPDIN